MNKTVPNRKPVLNGGMLVITGVELILFVSIT